MRRAAKRDANEAAIVTALEAVGATVERLSAKDAPDLLVGYRGVNVLLEVKRPAGKRGGTSHRDLLPGQAAWHAGWRGAAPVVARTVADALAAIGVYVNQGAVL